MARSLVRTVHLTDPKTRRPRTFGPGDDVPGWAAEQITNPEAWADDDARVRALQRPDTGELQDAYDAGKDAGRDEAIAELCDETGAENRDELVARLADATSTSEQLERVLEAAGVGSADQFIEMVTAPPAPGNQGGDDQVGTPPAGDGAPKPPPKNAGRDDWAAFAVTQGMDPADAEKATRDDLIDRYGG